MTTPIAFSDRPPAAAIVTPVPIVALDFPGAAEALGLVERLPDADFFKVGLQLFSAAGPDIVRELRARGRRVFLDLKLHDIPNTVANAVRAANGLGVELLTVHASGGVAMLAAAAAAARESDAPPKVLAVTILTSLSAADLARTRGNGDVDLTTEAATLARLAEEAGIHGVVTSVHEVARIRAATRPDFPVLCPGIRLAGDDAGDQARVATPADAARSGVNYIVIGRSVTAARDPDAAWRRAVREAGSLGRSEPVS